MELKLGKLLFKALLIWMVPNPLLSVFLTYSFIPQHISIEILLLVIRETVVPACDFSFSRIKADAEGRSVIHVLFFKCEGETTRHTSWKYQQPQEKRGDSEKVVNFNIGGEVATKVRNSWLVREVILRPKELRIIWVLKAPDSRLFCLRAKGYY